MPDDIGNWDFLPHRPLEFFGLSPTFDRKDLKRAYGRLIRQYKPESHPAEFQRIRAAYEDLDRTLRYRDSDNPSGTDSSMWSTSGAFPRSDRPHPQSSWSRADSGSRDRSPGERPSDVFDPLAVAAREPAKAYESLAKQSHRTPQEYFVLAVLSDVVEPDPQRVKFLAWLLWGLKQWPSDPGLIALVSQYFADDLPQSKIGNVLLETAQTLKHPVFYRVTEGLWSRYLKDHSFADFHRLLTRCESNVPQHDVRQRDVFYLYLMKQAIWDAPAQWTNEQLQLLEQDATRWDSEMHAMLEFLLELAEYLHKRRDLQSSPIGPVLDSLLRAYCSGDHLTHITEIIQHAGQLATQSHAIRSSFPIDNSEADMSILMLVMHVYSDLGIVAQPVEHEGDNLARNQQAVAAANDLRNTYSWAQSMIQAHSIGFRWLPMLAGAALIVLAPCIVLSVAMPNILTKSSIPIWSIAITVIVWIFVFCRWIYPRWLHPLRELVAQRWFNKYYERAWRERVFRYIQSVGEPIHVSIERMVQNVYEPGEREWIRAIGQWARSDVGLIILTQSQRFLV